MPDSTGARWPQLVIGKVGVDLLEREQVLAMIDQALRSPQPLAVMSANLDHIRNFADHLVCQPLPCNSADRCVCGLQWLTLLDGVPLVYAANARSGRRWPKLSGSDLIEPILENAALSGAPVGFLGGTEDTHAQLRVALRRRLPALRISGTWAPDRMEVEDEAASQRIAAEIRAAGTQILVVGLGKPRQEHWIARFGQASGARVLLAFGAATDFLAGRLRRAPRLMTATGAEWAWRLAMEPRRLWRRYLIEGPPALLRIKRSAQLIEPT